MEQISYDPKWETVEFKAPTKPIVLFNDVATFQAKAVHNDYLEFLRQLQASIRGKPISQTKFVEKFSMFQPYFAKLNEYVDEVKPIEQPMRYGNKAFKDWHELAAKHTSSFIASIVPDKIKGCSPELERYIVESFGSPVRIDYGTGHELSFMFFCWSLFKLGFVRNEDLEHLVRQIFYEYLKLMRRVQLRYMLEPAGSHGVWGIDDYHFLPFLLGGAELNTDTQ